MTWLILGIALFGSADLQAASYSPSLTALRAWEQNGPQAAGPLLEGARVKAPAGQEVPLSERGRRIEEMHSEPVIRPQWLPSFIDDVPAYRVVEGPTADKEGFQQRLWRVPLSPAIAVFGGAWDMGSQWSKVAGDGGDTFGRVAGAVLGGLFGFLAGVLVGAAGVVVNAGMAVKDLLR